MPIYAICPFFKYEKSKLISCEAGLMKFPSYRHMRTVSAIFCESFNYENCKRAQRLMKQYEEGKKNAIQEKTDKRQSTSGE